jgi:hypothetical protein
MKEMDKLEKYLKDNGYLYERNAEYDGEQIIVYDKRGRRQWDAVCHCYSYGHKDGLLEIMGTIVKDKEMEVEGYLTAQDIIERLEKTKC